VVRSVHHREAGRRDCPRSHRPLTLTGADKTIEAWMVDRMPSWLLRLTTAL
jgi:hypothetical protein